MRLLSRLCLLILAWAAFTPVSPLTAAESKPLLVIDGQAYFPADFQHWWENWRDDPSQRPAGVEPYLDWLLLAREGERMELNTLPNYQHKLRVFMEVRALMALKRQEIAAQATVSEDEIKASYERRYLPRRLVIPLEFAGQDQAQAFMDAHGQEPIDQTRLKELADGQGHPAFTLRHPQWLRPFRTRDEWRPLLERAQPGNLVGPLPLGEKTGILFLAEVEGADPSDYQKVKDGIRLDLEKRREDELTRKLVDHLRKKYQVAIDRQALAKIDLANPQANDQGQVVISSQRSKVTTAYFLAQYRRGAEISPKPPAGPQAQMDIKEALANTMIANSVVSWEALDRHYERQPPLKWEYQFYRQNLLARELESRMLGQVKVNETEAKAYYDAHPDDFKHQELVRVEVLSGDEAAIRGVWSQAITDGDLERATKGAKVRLTVADQTAVPISHLSPEVRQAIAGLPPGGLSQPFASGNGEFSLVRLADRQPAGETSFTQEKQTATDKALAVKRAAGRAQLVQSLKERSKITVNDQVWSEIKAAE